MYELPVSIEIQGTPFRIRENGDFRMVFSCFNALNDIELSEQERIIACLMIFYEDFNTLESVSSFEHLNEAIKGMFLFFNCGQEEQETPHNYKLIDWEKDSLLVCSAVNNVAQKEIRAEKYVHWWTFIGYYMAIGECALSTIVTIRYKILKGQKLEKHERKFRQENPQYFNWDARSLADKEADAYIKELWNSNKG